MGDPMKLKRVTRPSTKKEWNALPAVVRYFVPFDRARLTVEEYDQDGTLVYIPRPEPKKTRAPKVKP